ncbi:hypothetical protein ANRL4_03897 [Anaerolineae bacterium]|nr:hypothetical protein ANRL4_03897 [Anaerolineae bacterium]
MSQFGDLLQDYRRKARIPNTTKRVTLERFGELLGDVLGDYGYTGQAVSDWEHGKSTIRVDDRQVLLALVKVLYDCEGLHTLDEANALLLAGGYRPLDQAESSQVFPLESAATVPNAPAKAAQPPHQAGGDSLRNLLVRFNGQWRAVLAEAAEGPPPIWPRALAIAIGRTLDHLTAARILKVCLWLGVWLLTWALISPSLRWPFANQMQAREALVLYAGGTLLLPLLIGALTSTKSVPFWQEQHLEMAWVLRAYTYQGAFLGFNLCYLGLLAVSFPGYYVGIRSIPGLDLIAAIVPVGLGYAVARLVPYNLWRAYHRLTLSDGAIFFVFVLFGPGWSIFFYHYYALLLMPAIGFFILFSAITSLAGLIAWRQHKTGTSLIPVHVWVLVYGGMLILYEAQQGTRLFSVVFLAGVILTFAVLLAQNRMRLTLVGAIGLVSGSVLLWVSLQINPWVAISAAGVIVFTWWRWGRKQFWLPGRFWGVLVAGGIGVWLVQRWTMPEVAVSLAFSLVTLLILFLRKGK